MNKNEIYIKSGTNYKEMTKELLAQCGLASVISDKKMQIGIKPNLVSPSEASWGATTHPEIVAGIIEYLQENGYGNIAILEGSWVGDKTTEAYEVCGYRELTEKYQVPFWDMQKDKGIERDCRGMKLNVCERAANIDFLINVPVLKGHCQTKITCALKNMKGLIPNTEKRHFHAMGLHEPIAHLNVGLHQDFVVVDNICGDLDFEDGGNPVVMNRIWAGTDPVLIDSYVCQIMHYTTKDVPYIELAEKLGVGSTDLKNSRIVYCEENARKELPKSRKVVELQDAVEEVESCSACYGYLSRLWKCLKMTAFSRNWTRKSASARDTAEKQENWV